MTDTLAFETTSPDHTEELAARLGAVVSAGMLITLTGELGAGKTVFTRGLARGLNISGAVVTSPSYVLQHIYHGGRLPLEHLDAYRLTGGIIEFETSGLAEAIFNTQAVIALEWPERLGAFRWPADYLAVQIEHLVDPQRRQIMLRASGPRSATALRGLA
ncbi:MAG: tRNA (adenosine(37)-N6)-threonylcarbamoyltransferase complex ATPase subunit type 1 TsaE [Planctomycetota bacterium]